MKKILILLMILTSATLFGQTEEEILLSGNIEHGGFGGPHMSLSEVNGDLGILTGVQGGWIINHTYVLGLGGYTLQNEVKTDLEDYYLEMNYGGVQFSYIVNSDRVFHYYFQALIGSGTANYTDKNLNTNENSNNDWFWTIQPGAYVEMNVVNFFRISAGLNYRYVSGIELPNLSNREMSGLSATLLFKFGKF